MKNTHKYNAKYKKKILLTDTLSMSEIVRFNSLCLGLFWLKTIENSFEKLFYILFPLSSLIQDPLLKVFACSTLSKREE